MNVAVVGGGLFGVTTALTLADAGIDVDLYEKQDDIMTAASSTNQWRLHRGYHYPRSRETGRNCRDSAEKFKQRFPDAVIETADHYYCIAADDRTKTTGEEFLSFCEEMGLEYQQEHPDVVREQKIDVSVRVLENRIDPKALKTQCKQELRESSVSVHLGTKITDLDDLSHDYTVVAAYAATNTLLGDHESIQEQYKFELCEKPVASLPPEFEDTSVVVLDGPFMCFDPYGRTGNFLLGNVVHAIWDTTEGHRPSFDNKYSHLLNNGVVESPDLTKFDEFVESGEEFIPGLADADHVGSKYTIRTVLAGVEETDERPTIVEQEGDVFKIFSGKLGTCIEAAEKIREEIAYGITEL